jgi:TPP-dependent pyruvate/acetoin dehydrogenase alpha subunit
MAKPSKNSSTTSIALSSRKLKQLYATMLKCRMIEDRARLLFPDRGFAREQFIGCGLEAAEVGASLCLTRKDCIGPWGRIFIFAFLKGHALTSSFQRLFALADSPKEMSAIKAARTGVATGVGLACRKQSGRRVTVAFATDNPETSEFLYDMIAFSAGHKLPVVFVTHDRLCVRINGKQWRRPPGAPALELPRISVEANDVVAIHRVAQEAIRRAREGHGPALIECVGLQETQAARPVKKKLPEGIESWKNKDPLKFMENYLKQRNLWSDAWKGKISDRFSGELDEAIAAVDTQRSADKIRVRA